MLVFLPFLLKPKYYHFFVINIISLAHEIIEKLNGFEHLSLKYVKQKLITTYVINWLAISLWLTIIITSALWPLSTLLHTYVLYVG